MRRSPARPRAVAAARDRAPAPLLPAAVAGLVALALGLAAALALAAGPAAAQAPHSAAATGTPPGLAKKGGVPPGQARKWAVGRPLPDGVDYRVIRDWRRHGLPPLQRGERYIRVGDDVLRVTEVAEAGLLVLAAVGAVQNLLN
jgi:hypothetical protein